MKATAAAITITANERSGGLRSPRAETGNTTRFGLFCAILDRIIIDKEKPGPCSARVVLRQGVYHQIKRMFGVYGAGVNELRRTAIGGLALDAALGPGGFRELSPAEVARILGG